MVVAATAAALGWTACASAPTASWPLTAVDTYLDASQSEAGFSGVVLIAQGDDVLYEGAYGFADYEQRAPMTMNHVFRIGSLTKPLTAAAALVAVDKGQIGFEDRLCDELAGCPDAWSTVTLRDLLTQSSGIREHFGDLKAVPVDATAAEVERVVGALEPSEALEFPVGSKYAYRNFNYVLVGYMLERKAQKPWSSIVDAYVVTPAGMTKTAYDDVYAVVPGRARGYDRNEQGNVVNIDYDDHAAFAAGGLRSTAQDMFRAMRAEFGARLFRRSLVDEALTPRNDAYGYGWRIRSFFDRRPTITRAASTGFRPMQCTIPRRV